MVLDQKWPFFELVFFSQKNEKYTLFERVNKWFWSKNGHLSNLFFLGNIGKENVFYDILDQKKANVSYKNKKFKKSKN